MTVFEAIGLGVLQGATEFLPVSSSGHLTLAERAFGMEMDETAIALDVMLHAATLAALAVYFGRAWVRRLRAEPRLVLVGFVACLPAGVAYFAGAEGLAELAKKSLFAVAGAFILAGGFIMLASFLAARWEADGADGEEGEKGSAGSPLVAGGRSGFVQAALVGLAQAVALLPGVSRSGTTIGTGLLAGMKHEAAFEFSFLIGAPVILGAFVMKLGDVGGVFAASPGATAAGFVAAFAAGLGALALLKRVLARRKLWAFGAYKVVVGLACLGFAMGGRS
jgi:undecaprenyl-diphosphatase